MEPNLSDGRSLVEVLVFEVASQRYGLFARDVREIVRAVAVVPLPRAPLIVEGVFNLRGRVVPLLDLRRRFRLPARAIDPADHYVIATVGEHLGAIRADQVIELRQLRAVDIDAATSVVPYSEYVAGVAKLDDGLVLLHDLQTFLSQGESRALAESLDEGAP